MNRIKSLTIAALLTAALTATAQGVYKGKGYEAIKSLASYEKKASSLEFKCTSDKGREIFVKIDICTPDMLRIRSCDSPIVPREEFVVIKNDWDNVEFSVSEQPELITIATSRIKLIINKSPFRFAIYDPKGNPILQQSPAGIRRDRSQTYEFMKLAPDEHFFGFGAAAGIGGRMGFEGQYFNRLDKRGQKIDIVGRRVAFFMSTKGYGIFLNSTYPYGSVFRMGCDNPDVYSFESRDPQLDYYFIYGPAFKHILNLYTQLTGRTPLIPKWGFGTRQAGYWDQNQIEKYSQLYREKDIPCDVFHLDSSWLNKGSKYEGRGVKPYGKNARGYVDFQWDRRQFPDPNAMLAKLSDNGFKFSIWETALVNPNVGRFYDHAAEQNYFVKDKNGTICLVSYGKRGMTAIPDFSNPDAALWWKQQHKPLVDIGVMSFKLDHTGDLGTATNAVFHNGRNLDQMRMLHRLLNLQVTFDAVRDYTNARGMIWSSIATAGTQRYPITWCGDYRLTFEGLQEVIKSMQNMGLSGFGYYAPDIPAKRNIKDPHLYTRWAQFGLMNPLCQSWTVLPWDFGPQTEKSYRYYAKLHYRLLPYIYSYARIANQTGVPITRAMVLEYQDDPQVYGIDLQYFFGSELLIAPVCTESDSRQIYLPAGQWFDYNTGQKYKGPKTITYNAPADKIPVFVKAGAIIPLGPEMDYIGQKPTDTLTLDIYPYLKSSFTLYEDDEKSYDYEKGRFALTTFTCEQTGGTTTIDIGKTTGAYKAGPDKSYTLKVNQITAPDSARAAKETIKKYNSQKALEDNPTGWWYDDSKKALLIKLGTVKSNQGKTIALKGAKPI